MMKAIFEELQTRAADYFPQSHLFSFDPSFQPKLGEYGLFYNGEFHRQGNLLEEHNLSLEAVLWERETEGGPSGFYMDSPHVEVIASSPQWLGDWCFQEQTLFLLEKGAYWVEFPQITHRCLQLGHLLKANIESRIRQGNWDPAYVLVFSRFQSQGMNLVYAYESTGVISFRLKSPHVPDRMTLGNQWHILQNWGCATFHLADSVPAVGLVRYDATGTHSFQNRSWENGGFGDLKCFEEPEFVLWTDSYG